ncbi:hypothetical protein MUP32_07020, partial [Candidatus Microgenomates bacterium]|nr:hypothetical protein [Candidatus Microgenomates bacterium]
GLVGMGKTTLLAEFTAECHDREVPYAYMDLQTLFESEGIKNVTEIKTELAVLWGLAAGLKEKGVDLSLFDEACLDYVENASAGRYGKREEETHQQIFRTKVVDTFISCIKARSQKTSVVLLLDNVDAIPASLMDGIEREIIEPLMLQAGCRFVTTGLWENRWKEYAVRRHFAKNRLESFSPDLVNQQLRLQRIEEAYAGEVFGITGGYPVLTAALVGYMQEMIERGEELSVESFQAHQIEWMQRLVDEVVDGVVLEKASSRVIKALHVLANLPRFGPEIISQIIPVNVSEYSGPLSSIATREIRSQPVVHWSDSQLSYILEPALQRLLRAHLKITDPDRYREIHRQAACIYDKILEGWEADYRQEWDESGLLLEFKERLPHDLWEIGQDDIWEAVPLIIGQYQQLGYPVYALDYFQAAYHHRAATLRRVPAN